MFISIPARNQDPIVHSKISEFTKVSIAKTGSRFAFFQNQNLSNVKSVDQLASFSQKDSKISKEETLALKDFDFVEPTDPSFAKLANPEDWKSLDLYKLLDKAKCLEHHPDKKAALSNSSNDDKYFKCLQKGYAQLIDPTSRRQYDSVDPGIPDIEPESLIGKEFFSTYDLVFKAESRFSKKKNVPELGNMDTGYDKVTEIGIRMDFDSWRSYEFYDKEKESTENRDEKRFQDKANKAEREKLKKKDNMRLRLLVEQARKCDPRIIKYKKEMKLEKEKKHQEKSREEKLLLEKKLKEQQEKINQEKARIQLEEKKKQEEKKLIQIQKKNLLKARKYLMMFAKKHNFFYTQTNPDQQRKMMIETEFDTLVSNLNLSDTNSLNTKLEDLSNKKSDTQTPSQIIAEYIINVIHKIPTLSSSFNIYVSGKKIREEMSPIQENPVGKKKVREWTAIELEALVKAVKKFPGGSLNRWETIGSWITQHTGLDTRNNMELIQKSKELAHGYVTSEGTDIRQLQTHTSGGNEITNKFEEISVRYDDRLVQSTTKPKSDVVQWTKNDQMMLESMMKKYPPSWSGEGEQARKLGRQ
ncbi:hypothetical protein BB558_002555 [Smittium angustum]|uniref:J domain-containing protein n=1 Tax=Smittium angustum TaxID=133377 RepID=A0A2U1J8Q6_SMIAN|nr:hypothetical protein BB558_002555 [Smittium angustum]